MKIRTRFAPSPTGFMHVGNLRTALYEYLTARHANGTFVLRIEDTDQERYVEGAIDVIYDTLKLAGISHDEGPDIGGDFGPYVQSERLSIYKPYAEKLIEEGKAYRCFCSKERLAKVREDAIANGQDSIGYDRHCRDLSQVEIEKNLDYGIPYVIRQKLPLSGETTYHDCVYGDITIPNEDLDDQILLKVDGFPTYNFANVIDDHTMGITHIVRGCEYLSSTPKYNALYEAFGWDIPTYIHLPLIMGKSIDEEGKEVVSKLSKRHGSTGFFDLVNEGYLPQAIINYIALLGWAPSDNKEILTMEELINDFNIESISKSPSVFDYDKLLWMNGEYIKAMSSDEFLSYAKVYYDKFAISSCKYDLLEELLKPRITKFTEIEEKLEFLAKYEEFELSLFEHKKSKSTLETSKQMINEFLPILESIDESNWNRDYLGSKFVDFATEKEIKNALIMWPIRIAAAGVAVTPGGCSEVLVLLGREESLRRINLAKSRLEI